MPLGFAIPTMFLVIILSCLIYAFTIGLVNWRDNKDGLRTWATALCVHAGGYTLLALRGTIWDFLSIVVANTGVSLSYSLFLKALCIFLSRRQSAVRLYLPPVLMTVIFSVFIDNVQYRIFFGNILYIAQGVLIWQVLLKAELPFKSRGRFLIFLGLGIAIAITVWRGAVGLLRPQDMGVLFQASSVQVISYVAVFAAILLISNGYYMMAKERSDDSLRAVAMKDRLTGCWNRIHIEEIARQEMERLKRYGYPATLIMIDLDHFKAINDRYGHDAGDAALRSFSEVARQTVRATDVLGRWGGEEFVIILPSSSLFDALHMVERIRLALEQTVFAHGCRVTASFGISGCRATDSWSDWLARADKALYRAKHAGRNQAKVEDLDLPAGPWPHDAPHVLQLPWRAEYEIGEPALDARRRALLTGLNALLALGREPGDRERLKSRIVELLQIVSAHFREEERILEAHGWREAGQHKGLHAQLFGRAEELLRLFAEERVGAAEVFHFVVYEFTMQHILIEDHKLRTLFL